jgi:hypothetical protein
MCCAVQDREKIYDRGFFVGYYEFVWGVILLQAAGGLVKYFD